MHSNVPEQHRSMLNQHRPETQLFQGVPARLSILTAHPLGKDENAFELNAGGNEVKAGNSRREKAIDARRDFLHDRHPQCGGRQARHAFAGRTTRCNMQTVVMRGHARYLNGGLYGRPGHAGAPTIHASHTLSYLCARCRTRALAARCARLTYAARTCRRAPASSGAPGCARARAWR